MQVDWFFRAFGYETHIYRDKKLARHFDMWREDDDWLFDLGRFRGIVSPVRSTVRQGRGTEATK